MLEQICMKYWKSPWHNVAVIGKLDITNIGANTSYLSMCKHQDEQATITMMHGNKMELCSGMVR